VATSSEEKVGELSSEGIALVNKACLSAKQGEHGMKLVVGRDVIVPLMSSKNPQKEYILEKGLSPQQFSSLYKGEDISWGELLGRKDNRMLTAYVPSNKCARTYLGEFLNADPEKINGQEIDSPGEMIKRIETDPSAIGFCTLACLSSMEGKGLMAGISLVPIDMDGDGELERFEDIYGSYAELSHGIYVGKYPPELYSRIYALSVDQSLSEEESAFLAWVISVGQETLASNGVLKIDYSEKASGLNTLYPARLAIADVPVKSTATRNLVLLLAGLLSLGILVYIFTGRSVKNRAGSVLTTGGSSRPAGDSAVSPAGLFYDRSHTWAFMEKSGHVRIGMADFIQQVCGQLTRVALKSPGEKIKKGESLFTIVQQGKHLEIKSPISGVVVKENRKLLQNATLINKDPYDAGWVYMVEPANWVNDMKSFFLGDSYGEWLKSEFARLKDFFATELKLNGKSEPIPVMQDGGEIRDGLLEDFGPEVWEEFQANFINCK